MKPTAKDLTPGDVYQNINSRLRMINLDISYNDDINYYYIFKTLRIYVYRFI